MKKRLSKKNRYISNIVWERDHFKIELERTKDSKEFRPIHYLGDSFTKYAAQRRLDSLNAELKRINNDPEYTPWQEESDTWTDPAGGIHQNNEDDPAKMYE